MGYMKALDSMYCSAGTCTDLLYPSIRYDDLYRMCTYGRTHCYALGIEVAGFLLVADPLYDDPVPEIQ